jgi:hypothetical protein
VYFTLRGNNPELGLVALGAGRKPVMRRAVGTEYGLVEVVLLKRGVIVGETVHVPSVPTLVPKYPPSIVIPF